jgi:hypothetical protein
MAKRPFTIKELGRNPGKGGYCFAPETAKDFPHCDIDKCEGHPEYEFFPKEAKMEDFWYYLCREHLESIVGELEPTT